MLSHQKLPDFGPFGLRQHFGARGDGQSVDDASIRDWLAAGIETGRPLHAEGGFYLCRQPVVIDLTARRMAALVVTGEGRGNTRFELGSVSDTVPFQVIVSHGPDDQPDEEVAAFKSRFSGFDVAASFDGPAMQLGRDDFRDALNTFYVTDIAIDNSAASHANEALRVNHVLNSHFEVVANCHARKNKDNMGTAVHLRHSAFNIFRGSFANAAVGLRLSGGDSFANLFTNIDFEESNTAVLIDTAKARNNKLDGGQIATRNGFDFRAGENYVVDRPNVALRRERYDDDGKVVGEQAGHLIVRNVGLVLANLLDAGNPAYRPRDPG